MKNILSLILFFGFMLGLYTLVCGQEGIIKDKNRKKEYENVIAQANQLFDAKEYTASVYFYKKALNIAPEKKLAKYRLEDIETIFIKQEKAETKEEAEKLVEEIETTINDIEEQLPEEKKDSLIYYISDIQPARMQTVQSDYAVDIKMNNRTDINPPPLVFPEDSVKEDTAEKKDSVTIRTEHKVVKKDIPVVVDHKTNLEEQRKKIEAELKEKYLDKKTVEVIHEAHRTITKTIINQNNKITVYLEVKYDWGGLYYFIDKTPYPSQSITKNYFMQHTNIANEE